MARAVTSRVPGKHRWISARLRSLSKCESVNPTTTPDCSRFSQVAGNPSGSAAGASSVTSTSRKRPESVLISSANSSRPSFTYATCVAKLSISPKSCDREKP